MKKIIFLMAAAWCLMALVSCNSLSGMEETEENAGIPMVVSASIGNPATKLEYTYDESEHALKSLWSSSESVSVISLDASGKVLTIDKFTYNGSAGQKTIRLLGNFTGDPANKIVVLYPGLDAYEDGSHTSYGSPLQDGSGSTVRRAISGVRIGEDWATFNAFYATQSQSGKTDAVSNPYMKGATILFGTGSVAEHGEPGYSSRPYEPKVSLQPLTSVFRVPIRFGSKYIGSKAINVKIVVSKSDDSAYEFNPNALWFYFFSGGDFPAHSNQAMVYLGTWSGSDQTPIEITDEEMVFYIPFVPTPGAIFGPSGGQKIKISSYTDYSGSTTPSKTIELTSDVPLAAGKIYRFNTVTLE